MCTWIRDRTSSEEFATWVTGLNAAVWQTLIVLVVGLTLQFVARTAINKLSTRIIEGDQGFSRWVKETGILDSGDPDRGMRRVQRARAVTQVLRSVVAVIVYGAMTVITLSIWGVNVGPMLASASVLGVALGFGAQSIVRDFLSGIFMLIEDQYGVGDIIEVGDTSGTVEAVGLRVTRIRDIEGVVWYLRNGEITQLGNQSQGWARAVLDIGVGYETNIDHAEEVLHEVAKQLYEEPEWAGLILKEPQVWGVQELGDNAVTIRLVVTTAPLEQWKVARELRGRIKERFDQEAIEIPFPQQTVWYRDTTGTPQASPVGPHQARGPRQGECESLSATAETIADTTDTPPTPKTTEPRTDD